GNIVEAARHMRAVTSEIEDLTRLNEVDLGKRAEEHGIPVELVAWVATHGRLPVPNFSAGGVASPADAALMMQLGAEAVFVGSGIFKSEDPERRARAIVKAVTHFEDPATLAEVTLGLVEGMKGLEMGQIPAEERLARRGC
ncbi:MAG: pyridoxal 5'-phosphate synthase lyase subunit PdxS, partial [Planctomycetota bacterium]